ncbi:hypothetical protein MAR_029172, partial [Mya arenaria]
LQEPVKATCGLNSSAITIIRPLPSFSNGTQLFYKTIPALRNTTVEPDKLCGDTPVCFQRALTTTGPELRRHAHHTDVQVGIVQP